MKCVYLDPTADNVRPDTVAAARALAGLKVEYLLKRGIDKSGRGYFFPERGTVGRAHGRNIELGADNWVALSDVVEVRLL